MQPPPTLNPSSIAPGTRVKIRDEEWLVHRVDRTSTGTRIFGVVGLTPLVSGKEARFLEDIEREMGDKTKTAEAVIAPSLTHQTPNQVAAQLQLRPTGAGAIIFKGTKSHFETL